MYKAICDDCGAPCELPFRPSGEKPVFCRDCFGKAGGGKSVQRGNDSFRDRREDGFHEKRREEPNAPACTGISQEQFDALNGKLDKILKLITPVITVSKEMQEEAGRESAKKLSKAKKKTTKAKK
jgi:CxxC-x17-CxxC domain-containing protein